MKTELEVIAMRDDLRKEIDRVGAILKLLLSRGDFDLCQLWDIEYDKLVSQYNILIEVLK